jgi:hypothetical protein
LRKIEESLDILDTIPFRLALDYDKLKQNNRFLALGQLVFILLKLQ